MSQQNSQQQGQIPSNTGSSTSDRSLPPIRDYFIGHFPPHPTSSASPDLRFIPVNPAIPASSTQRPTPQQRTGTIRCPACSFVADRPSALEVALLPHIPS
ncbi:hypothetical protein Clacol_007327 [Clathrus columnatus]|uniref:Uncharacterized protein n=1 Tax=Clathrus columnatus TaxID=1419009 RepID=A0AAV5AHF5_9AGAM|nr:hypothetical protein Clacol_007327 [Clathrus columnatus]